MSGALSADEPVELVSADRAGPELSVKGGWRDAGQGRTCDLERGCVCVCVCVYVHPHGDLVFTSLS